MNFMVSKKLILGIVIVAAGAGAAVYFGLLDEKNLSTQARIQIANATSQVRAATDVSLPSTATSSSGELVARAGVCRDQLRRIESAKRAAAQKSGVSVGTVSWDAVIKELGGKAPACPSGGEYAVGTLEVTTRCSVSGNGTTDPADDHILAKF